MAQRADQSDLDGMDGLRMYVTRAWLERIITEHGGTGTTPDDAEGFLEKVGAEDAVWTLLCLKIETFRLRINAVLDAMERFAATRPHGDVVAMAADAQTILSEYIDICGAVGVVEVQNVVLCDLEDM